MPVDGSVRLDADVRDMRAAALHAAFNRLGYKSTLPEVAELVRAGLVDRIVFRRIERRQPPHIQVVMLYRAARQLWRRRDDRRRR